MRRTLRSNVRFERAVGALFEKFEGRERELRASLERVLIGLRTGDIKQVRQHHPSDNTACVPLIDDYVVVIRPVENFDFLIIARKPASPRISEETFIDIASTENIDLLTIEREPG